MLTEKQLSNRHFSCEEVTVFLALDDHKSPIWIKVLPKGPREGRFLVELQIRIRFRTPTQLQYHETDIHRFRLAKPIQSLVPHT